MTRRVLKANQVQSTGSFRLELQPQASAPPGAPPHGSTPARIRIAENHPQFALVEVTCSCGKTTLVRCEYAGPDGSSPPDAPAPS
jgi:hypothetical protein